MGKQVAKRRKPDWKARDEPGMQWKEKILEIFYKSLSLPSILTSHFKGKCGKKQRHGRRHILVPCMPWHLLLRIEYKLENQSVTLCGAS